MVAFILLHNLDTVRYRNRRPDNGIAILKAILMVNLNKSFPEIELSEEVTEQLEMQLQ